MQAAELEAKLHEVKGRVAQEQEGQAAAQAAMAAERQDMAKQGAALLDLGKQVIHCSCQSAANQALLGLQVGFACATRRLYIALV